MQKINKLKNGFFSRNIALSKMVLKLGGDLIKYRDKDPETLLKELLSKNSTHFAHELNMMKGSIMKAGQLISVNLGELLPENIRKLLSSLEMNSYFIDWEIIKKEIPPEFLEELDFEEKAFAAASIGQVHLATNKKNQDKYAVKIRYKGITKAVERDIFILKLFIKTLKVLPKELDLSPMYQEIKKMLYQEMDYERELKHLLNYQEKVTSVVGVKTVEPITEYCTSNILTTKFSDAIPLRDLNVDSLSLGQRNYLGQNYLHLFYHELFKWGLFQSDGNFGNFLVETKKQPDWVMLDFGATLELREDFLKNYQNLIIASSQGDKELFFEVIQNLNIFNNFKGVDKNIYWDYLEILREPFKQDCYDWGESQMVSEILKYIPKMLKRLPGGKLPSETIFADRKLASIFYVLKHLKCRFNPNDILKQYI